MPHDDMLPAFLAESLRAHTGPTWMPRAHRDDAAAIKALVGAYQALASIGRRDINAPTTHTPRGPRDSIWRAGPAINPATGARRFFIERRDPQRAWQHIFEADTAHAALSLQARHTPDAERVLEGLRAFTDALAAHHPMIWSSVRANIAQDAHAFYIGVGVSAPPGRPPTAPIDTACGGRTYCDNVQDLERLWKFRLALSRIAHKAAAGDAPLRTYVCRRKGLETFVYHAPCEPTARLIVAALSTAPALWAHSPGLGMAHFLRARQGALDSLAAMPVFLQNDLIATRQAIDAVLPG